MGQEKNYVDVWGIDHSKYTADGDAETVEEVIVEIEDGSAGDAEVVIKEDPDNKGGEKGDANTDANSNAGEKSDAKKDGDEKQTAVGGEKKDKEDASSNATDDETPIGELMQKLVDDDLLEFDEEKEYDVDSEQGLRELIQETVQKRSKEAIEKFKNDLGEEAKQLLLVLEKGGNVGDYIKMNQQIDFNQIPLEDSEGKQYQQNQKYLVEDWMKVQGYDEDEIKEMINDYLESGMLKKQAAIAQKKLASWQAKQNETLLAQKDKEKAEAAKLEQEQAESFKSAVLETREIAGFQITEQKAKKLYDYITKKDKNGKSQFDKEDTPENRLLYAYFAMEGFDKEKLSKEVASTQARTLKKKLSRFTDKNVQPKRGGAEQIRRDNQESPSIPWIV